MIVDSLAMLISGLAPLHPKQHALGGLQAVADAVFGVGEEVVEGVAKRLLLGWGEGLFFEQHFCEPVQAGFF